MTPDEKYNDELNPQELEHVLSAMKGMKVPTSSRSKEDAWNLIMQSVVEPEDQAKVVKLFNAKFWLAVAASVLIFIVAGWGYARFSSIEQYCPKGYVSDVLLPDGSQIKLNADSKVKYPKFFNLVGRKINLEGEAFFKVNPGDRFTVTDSKNRVVEVVGTEFNVKTRDENYSVVCYQGTVNVSIPDNKKIQLDKGKSLELESRQLKVENAQVDSIATPAWTRGEFYFDRAKLSDVFKELERQFNITIQTDGVDLNDRTYTGFFRNDSLIEALNLVALPMGLSYQFNTDSTVVKLKN